MKIEANSRRKFKLLNLVDEHRICACLNDLDRIYALVGLPAEKDDVDIEIDYGKSVEAVYQDFALKYLEKNDIQILECAGRNWGLRYDWTGLSDPGNELSLWDQKVPVQKRAPGLPGWVQDWRHTEVMLPFGGLKYFYAAKNVPPSILVQQDALPSIAVAGTRLDQIKMEISTMLPAMNIPTN